MASYQTSNTPRQHEEFLQRQANNAQMYSNSHDNTPRNDYNQQQHQQQQHQQMNNRQANQASDSHRNQNDHSEFMKHNPNAADYQQQKSLSLEYGKTIKLLRNGDEFYRGQKVVINSRKYRYFDVFLDDISDSMNAQFGAVRNIHTPMHGHKIKSLDEFEDGKAYVASGNGRFKRLKYEKNKIFMVLFLNLYKMLLLFFFSSSYLDISEGKKAPPPHRVRFYLNLNKLEEFKINLDFRKSFIKTLSTVFEKYEDS